MGGGALAAAALALLLVARSPDAPIPEQVIRSFVAQVAPRVPVSGDETDAVTTSNAHQLGRWLEQRVSYRVDIPRIDGAVLLGGRVIDLAGSPTAAVQYLFHDQPVIFVALPTAYVMGSQVGGEGIAAGSSGGYHVAIWSERGLARAVVGPLPRSAVVRFATECRARALRAS